MNPAPVLALVLLSTVTPAFLRAQCTYQQEAKLVANDPAASAHLGNSVAISGDTAIGGAIKERAYVYRHGPGGWALEQRLQVGTPGFFGVSVAIDGDTAAVGAIGDDSAATNAGAVYVFRRLGTVWSEEQKLIASDAAAADDFGRSVALRGNVLLVGASLDDDRGVDSGSIYVFRHDGSSWNEVQKLTASDGSSGDQFGFSLALQGNAAVAGAYTADVLHTNSGAAYVFRDSGTSFQQEAKLVASDGDTSDLYGWSVAIDGNAVLVGAYQDDDAGTSTGAAYVHRFNGTTWVQEQKLLASPPTGGASLGRSVALQGDLAVVGATTDGGGHGSCHVFQRTAGTWIDRGKLLQSDSAIVDEFGWSAAMDGARCVVSSRSARVGSTSQAGALYAFTVDAIALGINPGTAQPGDTVQFTICGGLPGGLVGLVLTGVNGAPTFQLLLIQTFGAAGQATITGTLGASVSPVLAEFRALGFYQPGKLGLSNPVLLQVQ